MRVLFASDAAGFGGAEILAANLASALRRQGLATGWAASRPDDRLRPHLDGVEQVEAPLRHKSSYLLRSVGAFVDGPRMRQVRDALARWKPDVVVVNQPDPEDGMVVAAAARALGVRTVALLHQPAPLPELQVRKLRRLRSAVVRRAFASRYDRIVVVSEASARIAREAWGLGDAVAACANGIVLPPPLEEGERAAARAAFRVDGRVVGFLGRLEWEKGVEDLLAAIRSLAMPGVQLLVAGEGSRRAALEAAAPGTVRFVGWQEPRRVLAASDLLAMPSHLEGLPLALLEAGALGVDVIASSVGGIPEVLEAGALVPPASPEALAAALRAALGDPAASSARAARLRARIHENHSIDAMASRFAALLPGGIS